MLKVRQDEYDNALYYKQLWRFSYDLYSGDNLLDMALTAL
jgi:hypothetical protein